MEEEGNNEEAREIEGEARQWQTPHTALSHLRPPGAPGSFYSLQHEGTVAALAHLTSSSPIVSEQRAKAKFNKTAETASAASQFVSLLLGKPAPATPCAGDGDNRAAIVYVDDTPGKGGFVCGPTSQAPFVRAADVELTRRRLEHLMPVMPSRYTGERCPNPKCVNSGSRSVLSPPTYDGTKETRLGECGVCGLIGAREAVIGANLIAVGRSQAALGAAPWRAE
ncbi:hypothetical protein JCM10296v2_001048 [Rhodotorula toruloides]